MQLYEEIDALATKLRDAARDIQGLIAKTEQSGLPHAPDSVVALRAAKSLLDEGSLKGVCERLGAASLKLRGRGNFIP
jgi:predicted xylose isomerase-like sugar epimerase